MINKVYFRTDQDVSNIDGSFQAWHGESRFTVGEEVYGKVITLIGYGYIHENVPCVKVFVEDAKLYCEIPMTSVARVYHSLED